MNLELTYARQSKDFASLFDKQLKESIDADMDKACDFSDTQAKDRDHPIGRSRPYRRIDRGASQSTYHPLPPLSTKLSRAF